ncbi:hypothetical protein [Demequina aurantiaca]|uniref:variant leucine-rich repeat-containing protein n=1 Tax=Demequina aurantiaca TaxID=676200 RepID=UPI003D354BA0
MYWTTGEIALLATGILFAVVVLLGRTTRARLSPASYALFASAAVICLVAAALLVNVEYVEYPPLVWLLPVVPAAVIALVLRDAFREEAPAASEPPVEDATPVVTPVIERPRAASLPGIPPGPSIVMRPTRHPVYEWSVDEAAARAHAHNPHTSATELADLAYEYPALRAAVAANPATPSAVLDWLATSGDPVLIAAISSRGSSMPICDNAARHLTGRSGDFRTLSRH